MSALSFNFMAKPGEQMMQVILTITRPLSTIANEIRADWSKQGKGVGYAAKPYLEAMQQLDLIKGRYYEDSAESVVMYFLANASSWRGEVAKRVKKELNDMLKGAR